MIDFATLQGLSIPEGVVTQITDESGRVIWAVQSDSFDGTLKVEKQVLTTYANETSYPSEEFILLNIYPKTNGTVSVTYGGLTKTITDTSGAAEPNAQQVFFGTFNGVSDEVETPASGILTIEGAYSAVGVGTYSSSSKGTTSYCSCITAVGDMSGITFVPERAFTACSKIEKITIPDNVNAIGGYAFFNCHSLSKINIPLNVTTIKERTFFSCGLTDIVIPNGVTTIENGAFALSLANVPSLVIPASVTSIGLDNPFYSNTPTNMLSVASGNTKYQIINNCLVDTTISRLIAGFSDGTIADGIKTIGKDAFVYFGLKYIDIPNSVTEIGMGAFQYAGIETLVIPASVTKIGGDAFNSCSDLTSVTVLAETPPSIYTSNIFVGCTSLTTITVPKGCGEKYKAATYWKEYADYIVEAS